MTELWQRGGPYEQKEIAWRLSKIAVLPVLMVFALGFGRLQPRSSRYVSMFSALLVYFTYSNLVTMACARIPNGGGGAMTVLAAVHIVFAIGAAYLFWRRAHDQPLLIWGRHRERTA
jgi:lipopolysaccharide export system permease protein